MPKPTMVPVCFNNGLYLVLLFIIAECGMLCCGQYENCYGMSLASHYDILLRPQVTYTHGGVPLFG